MNERLRESRRAAIRFVEATKTTKRRFVITPKLAKLERKRLREKSRATRALRSKLLDVLDSMRVRFFAVSGLGPFLRESDDGNDRVHNDQRVQAAAGALTPDQLAEALATAMRDMYAAGITSAADELAQTVEGQAWDVAQTRALKAIDAYALKFAKNITSREKAALKSLIRDSIKDGLSTVDLASAISDHFEDGIHYLDDAGDVQRTYPTDAWAEMVARTETTRAYNAGNLDLYRQADVERVMWLTAEDERVCPECEDLDGEVTETGGTFEDGVDAPPLHPSCRCTLVIAPDDPLEQADTEEEG